MADRDLDAISTAEIAERAGVGKGSVFRAFGDKAGLARALLDDDERALQQRILSGRPPLGPGRDTRAIERVRAFVATYADFLERNVALLLVADADPIGRFCTGAYRAWVLHLRLLLDQIRPGDDNEAAAEAVLALLAPERFRYLRTLGGYSKQRFRETVVDAADRLASPGR